MREEAAGRSPRSPRSLRDAGVALAGLSAVFLFEMLDNSILNVALPTIGRDLHASTIALQWVTAAYAVVFGGLMLVFGAITDRFGRRRIMQRPSWGRFSSSSASVRRVTRSLTSNSLLSL